MYICVKFPSKNMNLNPFSTHSTSIYTYEVTIIPRVWSDISLFLLKKKSFHSFKLKARKNLLQIRRGLDNSIFTISDHCISVPVQYSEEPI